MHQSKANIMKARPKPLNNLFWGGGAKLVSMNTPSKILDFDSIMKVFFVERNNISHVLCFKNFWQITDCMIQSWPSGGLHVWSPTKKINQLQAECGRTVN